MSVKQSLGAFFLRIGLSCLSASLVLLIGAPLFFSVMSDVPFGETLYDMSGAGGTLWAVAAACFACYYALGRGGEAGRTADCNRGPE